MKVLVVGGGGREHAIIKKLQRDAMRKGNAETLKLFAAPGNPGIAQLAVCVPIAADDIQALLAFARDRAIDLTIVGPEVPLALGIVDLFEAAHLRIFGPRRQAAMLESSKSFAKLEMIRAGVPTPRYETFTDLHKAIAYLQVMDGPIVVKADGLAAGKGVTVAQNRQEAELAVRQMMLAHSFGEAGQKVVIEQYLRGTEMSAMAFVDGSGFALMPPIKDHKSIFANDEGPNTGGMGTVTPVREANETVMRIIREKVFGNLTTYFRKNHITYRGVLFAGIIVLNQMAYVIEFNARFGDPETQLALELLDNDLLEVIDAVLADRVADLDLRWSRDASVCVVLTSSGYPGHYRKGDVIDGLDLVKPLEHPRPLPEPIPLPVSPPQAALEPAGWRKWFAAKSVDEPVQSEKVPYRPVTAYVLHAGTATREDGKTITAGGRVLNVIGRGPTVAQARSIAYEAAGLIRFHGKYVRTDIGQNEE
ncbi:MAG: phosphoribosylamine--glycine ligase [Firmicutes bacterium]|nr:phosphoribosylamine--glycine ligase [Bacillota bacterium]